MKKQVAIYARVSSHKQKEGETIHSQISNLIEFAEKNDYKIPEGWIFSDNGFKGSTFNRPALNDLRGLVYEGLVDAVLVYSPDRLSRKYAFQLILEIEFEKQGVELLFLNTPRATNPEEQLSMHFKAVFAEYERAQIADRCRRGKIYRAKQGSASVISKAPLGYSYNRKSINADASYVINKDAEIVKLIFKLYVKEGCSLRGICKQLEENGILTGRGEAKWHVGTVRTILKNQAYIGVAHYGKSEVYEGLPGRIVRSKGSKSCTPKEPRRLRPAELWIPIRVPQIVSESDFEIAQEKLTENKSKSSRNTQRPSILQGLVCCGQCQSTYYKKIRGKYTYYICSGSLNGGKCPGRSVRANDLDEAIWEHVMELLSNPKLLEEEINRRAAERQDNPGGGDKIKWIEKELLKLSKARDKLLDAYQEGDCLTVKDLKVRMKGIDLKEKNLISERKSLEEHIEIEKKQMDLKNMLEGFKILLKKTSQLSIKEKQNVLRLLVDEIVVTDEEIEIRHCIPCSSTDSQISPLCSAGQDHDQD